MKITNFLLFLIILICGVGIGLISQNDGLLNYGGVTVGNEYTATSTPTDMNLADGLIRQGWGSLGSITITGAGTAEYWLLDSTTSLADSDVATSTVLLGVVPASLAAGTYVFDVQYTDGLYLDVMVDGTGTSTISYR